MKIRKETFQEDFPYLFKLENQDYEIKLDKFEIMELFDKNNEVLKHDIRKINELYTLNSKTNVLLINFFCDSSDIKTIYKLQNEFDKFCDSLMNEPLCMWCTTSQIYNTKKLNAEIFLAL